MKNDNTAHAQLGPSASFDLFLRGIVLRFPLIFWFLFKIDHDRAYRWFIPEDYLPDGMRLPRHL